MGIRKCFLVLVLLLVVVVQRIYLLLRYRRKSNVSQIAQRSVATGWPCTGTFRFLPFRSRRDPKIIGDWAYRQTKINLRNYQFVS